MTRWSGSFRKTRVFDPVAAAPPHKGRTCSATSLIPGGPCPLCCSEVFGFRIREYSVNERSLRVLFVPLYNKLYNESSRSKLRAHACFGSSLPLDSVAAFILAPRVFCPVTTTRPRSYFLLRFCIDSRDRGVRDPHEETVSSPSSRTPSLRPPSQKPDDEQDEVSRNKSPLLDPGPFFAFRFSSFFFFNRHRVSRENWKKYVVGAYTYKFDLCIAEKCNLFKHRAFSCLPVPKLHPQESDSLLIPFCFLYSSASLNCLLPSR